MKNNNIKRYIKSIPYLIKTGLNSVKRNIAMSIGSATAVTITLILMLLFVVVAFNVGNFTKNIEQGIQILARIDKVIVDENEIAQLQQDLSEIPNVVKIEFSSREQELLKYIDSMDMDKDSFKDYFGDNNPMYAAFLIDVSEGQYIDGVKAEIEKYDEIFDASYGGASASSMIEAFNSVRLFIAGFVIALSVLAIFLISNTIKLTILARESEISIMRSVGATNAFIKTPFMVEGMTIGLMGAIIPVFVTIFGYGYLYDYFAGQVLSNLFVLIAPAPFVYLLSLGLCGLGMLVGLIGSFVSVTKYLKLTR